MTEHSLQLVRARGQSEIGKARHPLDRLDVERLQKHISLFRPAAAQINEIVDAARPSIPGMTSNEVVHRVVEHNPDCLWALTARRRPAQAAASRTGFIAILPLKKRGLQQLAANVLNTREPDLSLVARRDEQTAGIYVWGIYAPGILAAGVALLFREVESPPYNGVDVYTRPNTLDGERFNQTLGLVQGAHVGQVFAPHLYVFRRSARKPPPYDTRRSTNGAREISVAVARSVDDLMRVMSVRTAVYMAEQRCPYDEEFDGNDFSATHLIGYVGDEPAGCLRIRFFADFAKIERVAVREPFRQTRLAFHLIRGAIEVCRMKGYRRLYGHAQKRLANFWSHFGFKVLDCAENFVFSDHDYVEMLAEFDRHPDAIRIGTDPYVIIRPEGRWHLPGILERSAARRATDHVMPDRHS